MVQWGMNLLPGERTQSGLRKKATFDTLGPSCKLGGIDVVEAEWVKRAQAGDRETMIRLLREIETPVYRTAYYLLGNEQDALDATQEALLKIYHRISTFQGQSRFETWAQRIVTNICIDQFRRKSKVVPMPEEMQPVDTEAEQAVHQSHFHSDLKMAISQLPDQQRTAVVLRYVHDYSYQEIAETMNLPINTVKSHLFRARKQLQELLAEYKEGGVAR